MTTEYENRAWHIAGHAYAAMAFRFSVHKLSMDGFIAQDLENCGDAQRLDAWTMVCPPLCPYPIGSFGHTDFKQRLAWIAIAGPILELVYRKKLCTLESVWQFADDWTQAWSAAGFLWKEETSRLQYLSQQITRGTTFMQHQETEDFVLPVAMQLLQQGTMNADEVQSAWERKQATGEARVFPPLRRRIRLLADECDCEDDLEHDWPAEIFDRDM